MASCVNNKHWKKNLPGDKLVLLPQGGNGLTRDVYTRLSASSFRLIALNEIF